MNSVWDILYLRRMALDYVAPPICEVLFSGSSNPVIILSNSNRGKVTGLVLGGFSGFRLSWNSFPGSLCFNIYHIAEGTDVAVLLAECVQDGYELPNPGPGPGNVVVTPITPDDGEGEPSDPIPYPAPGGGTSTVSVEAFCRQAARNDFPGSFLISREPGDTIGNLLVNFTLSGEAVNGTDYDLTPLTATIPNGSDFVIVDIAPVEAVMSDTKSVIITLTESFTYAVGDLSTAFIVIRPPMLRITDFGNTQPFFTVSAEAEDSAFCDWDGTWNFLFAPGGPSGFQSYRYQDANGQTSVGTDGDGNPVPMEVAITGKAIYTTNVAGPYNFPTPGTWQVQVLSRSGLDSQIVWQGLKQGGDITSPAGTYIWNNAGSDNRPTLDIELFP